MYVKHVEVLIDTWWNVNTSDNFQVSSADKVLIDTWWNVNTLQSIDAKTDSTVLIDTWWNVNMYVFFLIVHNAWF